jgi:RimJ/RimL family protein N-acetyltransferase
VPARRLDVRARHGPRDGRDRGVFTISQIVRGAFQSAFLGYYAGAAFAGQGYMRDALQLVVDLAFGPVALHRLEANIQRATPCRSRWPRAPDSAWRASRRGIC